jgi:hypothetical protein
LRPQLRGILVVEYPTINVFLPSDNYDFEIEKMVNRLPKDGKNPGSTTDEPPVEGSKFHEEEIEEGEFSPETEIIDLKDRGTSNACKISPADVTSESKIVNNVDSSVLSYPDCQALHGHPKELNQYSKMSPNGTSGPAETTSHMEVCPLDMEKTRESRLCSESEGHILDLKGHGTSYPGSIAVSEGAAVSKIGIKTIDSSVASSISTVASDGVMGPQLEHSQQNKRTPSSTPEALRRKSCMKVYPLDFDERLFPEVPDLAFEKEMMDTYPDLFENMDVDDFLSCDFAMMNRVEPVEATSGLLWDDLEEGEIPTS